MDEPAREYTFSSVASESAARYLSIMKTVALALLFMVFAGSAAPAFAATHHRHHRHHHAATK
jgi:hypothetical protein